MNVLLIGGTGFLGTWLTKTLCEAGHTVQVSDVRPFTAEKLAFLPSASWRWQFDGSGLAGILANSLRLMGADVVVPLFGLVGSVSTTVAPMESLASTAANNLRLLLALAKSNCESLVVFPSTDLVYRPRCMYSLHKLLVEQYLEMFHRIHGIPYVVLRIATVYGPLQKRDSVVNFFVRRALAGKSIPVYGKGNDRRAFIYASDAADAMKLAIEGRFPKNCAHQVVGHNRTLTEIAETVSELVGGQVEHVPWPELASAVDVGDLPIGNHLAQWGWKARVGLGEGIEKTKEWMENEMGKAEKTES